MQFYYAGHPSFGVASESQCMYGTPWSRQNRLQESAGAGGFSQAASYGLRQGVLSPMETLAQSVSTIAPTATPVATIPLVCALAGNGTWLAYVLATSAILLVALCVSKFARYSASPGSLYSYASMVLPSAFGATAAWSLLLAYVATGSSVIGGFYHYGNLLLRDATGHGASAVLLAIFSYGNIRLDCLA